MIGHAILLHSLCKVKKKAAGMACMIKPMYLHEVCGSIINSCVVHDLTLTNYLTHCGWWRVWGWGGLISVWGGCGQGRRERRDVTSVRSDSVRSGRSVSRRRGTSGCCGSSCIRSAIVWKTRYCHSENGPPKMHGYQNYFFGGPPGAYFDKKILPLNIWTTSQRWNKWRLLEYSSLAKFLSDN